MNFTIIAAMDENRGIGKNNALPWHLSADLKHFAATTKGAAVIMGRKTWESLPDAYKPLKERLNIVVSRGELELSEGVKLAHSLDEALSLAIHEGKAFIIGGATLYAEAIQHPACKELLLTHIEGIFDCDTFFPDFSADFKLVLEETPQVETHSQSQIRFHFARYLRP